MTVPCDSGSLLQLASRIAVRCVLQHGALVTDPDCKPFAHEGETGSSVRNKPSCCHCCFPGCGQDPTVARLEWAWPRLGERSSLIAHAYGERDSCTPGCLSHTQQCGLQPACWPHSKWCYPDDKRRYGALQLRGDFGDMTARIPPSASPVKRRWWSSWRTWWLPVSGVRVLVEADRVHSSGGWNGRTIIV